MRGDPALRANPASAVRCSHSLKRVMGARRGDSTRDRAEREVQRSTVAYPRTLDFLSLQRLNVRCSHI